MICNALGPGRYTTQKTHITTEHGCSISLNYHTSENNGMVFHMINVTVHPDQ
jgi:hypothetical protein